MKNPVTIVFVLLVATPAFAQKPPLVADKAPLVANNAPLVARATETIDPARVAAARTLLDVVMPSTKRDGMIDGMLKGMMVNLSQMMVNSPKLKAAYEGDPRAGTIFQRFFVQQQQSTIAMLKQNFPGMVDAMARAYARRFTTAQMGELRAFFETPTGRLYIDQAATIASDPDVANWQRDLMAKSMARIPADVDAMMAEIKALPPKGKP